MLRRLIKWIDQSLGGQRFLFWRLARYENSELKSIKPVSDSGQCIFFHDKMILEGLFDAYGSDKGSRRTSSPFYEWTPHNYASFYRFLFGARRLQIRLVFECGLGTNDPGVKGNMGSSSNPGASLRAWREYFPNAFIVGADIDRTCLFQEDRIATYWIDQTNATSVRNFWNSVNLDAFDIMIDDGLHTPSAAATLFSESISRLSSTGVYIIEDVPVLRLREYIALLDLGDLSVSVFALRREGRPNVDDNCLIVIQKSQ